MEEKPKRRSERDRVDDLYKILLIGDVTVGKTGLLRYFTENPTENFDDLPTIGIDFKVRTVSLDGKRIKLQLWDTAGAERFRTLTKAFYRGSHGLIIVYDLTNKDSFDSCTSWLKMFKENAHSDATIPTILIGNKLDISEKRAVNRSRAEQLSIKHGLRFIETSAKTGENVEKAFLSLAEDIKFNREKLQKKNNIKEERAIKVQERRGNTKSSKLSSWMPRLSRLNTIPEDPTNNNCVIKAAAANFQEVCMEQQYKIQKELEIMKCKFQDLKRDNRDGLQLGFCFR